MPRTLTRPALVLLCVALALPALALPSPDIAAVDAYVDAAFKAAKTVGGSLVVMKGEEVVYTRDWGYKDVRAKLPVDEGTVFRVGSITKMVTGIGLLRLVERGALDLDAPIGDYLGYAVLNPRYPRAPVTLRQLMSHTSSIADGGGYSSLKSTLRGMLHKQPRGTGNFTKEKPGADYLYTNLGAGIAGALMEAASGQSVDTFMRGEVFALLGIRAAYAATRIETPLT